MSKEDILKRIVKYNLLANIPSTLQWHIAQLQELLCMVKHFGMPHLFLTFTVDETSSLQWEEIIDIERIAKQIHTSLDWKDSLVECIILIHYKVDKFIQLLLSSHRKHKTTSYDMKFNNVDHFMPTSSYGLRKMTLNIS
jgi:hypothetical protein